MNRFRSGGNDSAAVTDNRSAAAPQRMDDASVSSLLADGDPCPTSELPALQIEALSWSNGLGQTE